jgi:hypothetical protein
MAKASHGRQARRAADQERWFADLEASLVPAGTPTVAVPPPALELVGMAYPIWIDGLIGLLWLFLILGLVAGFAVAGSTDRTEWRVAAIAGAVFWATLLAAGIAVLRLLQRIAVHTHRPPAERSPEPAAPD